MDRDHLVPHVPRLALAFLVGDLHPRPDQCAQCGSPYVLTCNARVFTSVMYLNYRFSGLDNLSFRAEFYNDMQGQRTGTKTRYDEFGIGLQHWLSPQIEFRPE